MTLSENEIVALKKRERQYRLLFQNLTMAFALHEILLDEAGNPIDYRFLEVNPAFEKQTGLKASEILGKTVRQVLPKTEPYWIETYGRVALTGEPIQFEHYSAALGKHYNVTAYCPEPGQFACLFLDITESVELKKRLMQAQKMETIGSLAGGIAHDFNNILFPISGIAQMMMWDAQKGSPERENLEKIYNASKRAAELVKQILAFSRQTETIKMPMLLQPVVKEVFKLTRSTIPANFGMSLFVENRQLRIVGDSSSIHQVLMNLITNAYHAIQPTGGSIHLALEEAVLDANCVTGGICLPCGRYARIRVRDTGCGIDEAIREKIFDPYFTTKPPDKGTGLGLSVVRGIVNELGGEILLESEPGKGACFDVYLPLLEESAHEADLIDDAEIPGGSETILLVDDEQPIVDMEKRMLERMGYRVDALTGSGDALALFRADPKRYDLVISDMSMSGMTGDALLKQVLAIRPDIPTILCTGYTELISEERVKTIGIRALLPKPLAAEELAVMIRKVLETQ
jgi:PAS domain S-box-containing protein